MRGLSPQDTEAIFDQLDALGWINRTLGPYKGAPPHGTVNPAVHAKFAERASAEAERRARERSVVASVLRGRHAA